jgi:hypothetical protein
MGHVKGILERIKTQGVAPVSSGGQLLTLPGLCRAEQLKVGELDVQKREYNRCLKALRNENKKLSNLKGEEKKDAKKTIAATKAHMSHLMTQIGTYTTDEQVYGFKEVRDAE